MRRHSGETQWGDTVGRHSGETQWGDTVGETQWGDAVGRHSGETQWGDGTCASAALSRKVMLSSVTSPAPAHTHAPTTNARVCIKAVRRARCEATAASHGCLARERRCERDCTLGTPRGWL